MILGNQRRRPLARKLLALSLTLAGGVALTAAPSAVVAQTQPAIRIAVVNPAKVFAQIDEKKALQDQNEAEQRRIEAQSREKANAIQALAKARGEMKPGTPQFEDTTNELLSKTADYKVWAETERLKAEFNQKKQTKILFDKIQAAVTEVAARDGIDLVLTDSSEPFPDDLEKIDIRALRAIMLQRNVLHVSQKQGLDITDAVILVLNAKYKQSGAAIVNPTQPPK
jgi:Skp family chaperone for outer membrane proteins